MTHTPIDLALNAVYELFSTKLPDDKPKSDSVKSPSTPPKLKAYTDDSSSKLEELVGQLNTVDIPHPVLIRMGSKEAKKRHPYAELLQQTLEERRLGVSGSIHSIVADLLEFHKKSTEPEIEPEAEIERKPLTNFNRSKDLRAGDIEIYIKDDSDKSREIATKSRQQAANSLLNWAQLESCLVKAPKTSFSRLAGGIRPLVYVFDDYSNFIQPHPQCSHIYFSCKKYDAEKKTKIDEFYRRSSSSQSKTLDDAIDGFSNCLNNLSVVFDVRTQNMEFTPKVEAEKGEKFNYFQQVADILKFSELEENRNQIGAFIIDLEWLPSPNWIINDPAPLKNWTNPPGKEQMGHYAVRLLTQRYPEIPCFIFTGMWSIETLQQSLAAGAAWCFQKPLTHHLGSGSHPSEELNYFNLEHHLTEFAELNYGSYQDLPNVEQFDTSNDRLNKELKSKIGVNLSELSLRKLIASQFTSERVEPVKLLNAGKSGALATFFVQPQNNEKKIATRFLKIDSWFNTQVEYFAYQQIIKPLLNNHVAHVIFKPTAHQEESNESVWTGIITSSLAGFPEDYKNLNSLERLISEHINRIKGGEILSAKIFNTLKLVLLPLHQPPAKDKTSQKDHFWIGKHFGFLYKAELIPIAENNVEATYCDCSIQTEFSDRENITRIIDKLNNVVQNVDKNPIILSGWQIDRIRPKDRKIVALRLMHPLLGSQIELEGDSEDLTKRFNHLWLRPKMSVELKINLSCHKQLIQEADRNFIQRKAKVQQVSELLRQWDAICENGSESKDPFEILDMGDSIKIEGLNGVIHGDLNLNNILYAENENAGFLIDFAKTRTNGLVVFDLASLEERIWKYFLMPNLISIGDSINFSPSEADETIYRLLRLCLHCVNAQINSVKLFESKYKEIDECKYVSLDLFLPVLNLLETIDSIRNFTREYLSISDCDSELIYALGISSLRRVEAMRKQDENLTTEIKENRNDSLVSILSYISASYYLTNLLKT